MTDRLVRQIAPVSGTDGTEERHPFSVYADHPNIVLLGDPGAGKSHLFRHFASLSGGTLHTARSFLNVPSLEENAVVFIDALDEKRSGRGDQDTIDAIVRKLFEVKPKQVRISCRVVDWLGATDFAAFHPYFEAHGRSTVLVLEALLADEQQAILSAESVLDPSTFIEEATNRGLDGLLSNPQNLIMLSRAVKGHGWPSTRKELFEITTELLLSEPNSSKSRSGDGVYTTSELRSPAGAACSIRLISDVEGISLTENSSNSEFPSYRTLVGLNSDKVRAALGRRVFTADRVEETVDYSHRTIAEYLGATWLASRVNEGLPIGRVRALMGIDGHPAPELRGLHAWLAALLPEHAETLIDADPYGVLTYGDAASLTPTHRRRLLDALARLSEADPWFHSGDWTSSNLGALSTADMTEAFRAILRSKKAAFGLRSIVLDALTFGTPLLELQNDLLAILIDRQAPYAERKRALDALARMGADTKERLADSYRMHLVTNVSDVRLRADILSRLYGASFGPADVVALLSDALNCKEELPSGALWSIAKSVPLADIAAILDCFEPTEQESEARAERRNTSEVLFVIDRLLLRVLQENRDKVSASQLWKWLLVRHTLQGFHGANASEELKQELCREPATLRAVVDKGIGALTVNEHRWRFMHQLREVTLRCASEDILLELLVEHITRVEDGGEKQAFLYELALALSISASPRALATFEALYMLGDTRPDFSEIRDRVSYCTIEDWHREDIEHRIRRDAESQEGRARNLREFEKHKEAIRNGTRSDWLSWIAQVYFAHFRDVDKKLAPRGRLAQQLGEDNTEVALEGLIAGLRRADLPPLEAIAHAALENSYPVWWLAVIAGMDQRWAGRQDLMALPESTLATAIAIDLVLPTGSQDGSTIPASERGWKDAILVNRPELVRDTYLFVAQVALKHGTDHVPGLYELLTIEAFAPFRKEITLQLLRDYPSASPFNIQRLLCAALSVGSHQRLLSLARTILKGTDVVDNEKRGMWLAAAYLAFPSEFETELETYASSNPGVVWMLRDFSGFDRSNREKDAFALTVTQMEFIGRIAARHFPPCPYPSDGWSGDKNPWDGAEFVLAVINQLSADPSPQATEALSRLAGDDALASYRDYLKHALANQRTRRRDVEYRQPNWRETIEALLNGTPANIRDLHALVLAHLGDLKVQILSGNTDVYKRFWNEDAYGRVLTPKPEESCRDVLVDLLRSRLGPLNVFVEPEGHMAANRRVDISLSLPGQKIVLELKRDYHKEVWTAAESQLDRFYTWDPEASGFGIYGVFWFGDKRTEAIPSRPYGGAEPQSAAEMEEMLRSMIPPDKQHRLAVVVIDVSGSPH